MTMTRRILTPSTLFQLEHLPEVGEHFDYEGWRFEIVDLDGRRIDKVLAIPPRVPETTAG